MGRSHLAGGDGGLGQNGLARGPFWKSRCPHRKQLFLCQKVMQRDRRATAGPTRRHDSVCSMSCWPVTPEAAGVPVLG